MENVRLYGLIIASGGDIWISTQNDIQGIMYVKNVLHFAGHDRDVVIPVSGGLAAFDEDAVKSSKGELEGYLKLGMPMKGTFDLIEEDGALKLRPVEEIMFFYRPFSDQASWPGSKEKAQIDVIAAMSELLSAYTEQKMRAGLSVTIEDWQGPDRADKTTSENIRMDIKVSQDSLLITSSDGRRIDIELQDDVLRAFAYEPEGGKEAPVKINMHKDGEIYVDTHDYECDRGIISDMKP